MRVAKLVNDTCLLFGSLGSDNLEKAKTLICQALNLDPSTFESRYSDYLGGWYYRHQSQSLSIYRNDGQYEKGIRIICQTENIEQSQQILEYYEKNCLHGKPVI